MKKTRLFIAAFILLAVALNAQKKPLTHDDYDIWKSLSGSSITDDGRWITYTINPQKGDGWLYFFDVRSSRLDSVARGRGAQFSPGTNYIAYTIVPPTDEVRQARVDGKRNDDLPKNDIAIRMIPSGETKLISRVKSFSMASEESEWIAYLLEKKLPEPKEEKEEGEEEKEETPRERSGAKEPAQKGDDFVIFNPVTNKEHRFTNVVQYNVANGGASISFVTVRTDKDKNDTFTVNMFDTGKEIINKVFEGTGTLRNLSPNRDGDRLAFIFTADTGDIKLFDIYLSEKMGEARKVIDAATAGMPDGWCVSEHTSLSYSEDNSRLFFGTAEMPVEEPEDTLLADEKFSLDVWSWHDDRLQPMQLSQLRSDQRRNFQAVYHISDNKMVQLADESMPSVRLIDRGNADFVLGTDSRRFRRQSSWDTRSFADYYYVDIKTGARTMIMEAEAGTVQTSPTGKYIVYWCIDEQAWISLPAKGGEKKILTSNENVSFFNELHDSPNEPRPHGIAGWLEDERHLVIYDRYDMWLFDAENSNAPVNITGGEGRANDMRFRYINLDRDERMIGRRETMYLSAFNFSNKQDGFYTVAMNRPGNLTKLIMDDCSFGGVTKPKDADLFMFTKGTYQLSREIHLSNLKFGDMKKVSVTNPQQDEYIWGTVELVEWTSFNRDQLQGLLYKPENFDPNKKYPMIVYFYERSSDGLHSYSSPAPSASTLNRTYAVSNGYIVFVPDIPYREGYPGESCYNAVVSGTYALLDRHDYIDENRLGLDGQSWGGYQIAWLITQTDLYAAAFAGAPVSNMTSAYGGIRWGTGMSRMFQYEDTQSRIGGTLWEKPIHYIENSPLFFVPKINTPLLMMHNDEDGAVPWYQGIEMFVAMRRLDKPVWMLNYNGEAHNLVRRPARMDLSIRKMQFFDHYLMNQPMPEWMKYGVPATDKNVNRGYELVK
jgi:dipeptidyl aminopeptidase/acylaminoacyl peptidase